MTFLLDVDLLAACIWESHLRHDEANPWLAAQPEFFTCPATEMGFLRVSLSPGYAVAYGEARLALAAFCAVPTHRFLADHTTAAALPPLGSRHAISDAHLVTLARNCGLNLATLDARRCRAPWADGIAVNPLGPAPAPP